MVETNQNNPGPLKTDVIIIGAGLSGLSAAHFLKKSEPDLQVVLLEKKERAGGAVQSFKKDGFLAAAQSAGLLHKIDFDWP